MVDAAGTRTRARVARDSWSTGGPSYLGRNRPESWSTPRALRPRPKWPGTAGKPRGTLDTSARPQGQLFETRAFGHEPESPRNNGRHWVPRTQERDAGDSWSTPQALRPGSGSPSRADRHHGHSALVPESPGRAGRHRGLSDTCRSCLGYLEDHARPWVQFRVARDSCSTPRALRSRPESPGTPGLTRGTSDHDPSRPGQLVQPTGHRTQPRVARESW